MIIVMTMNVGYFFAVVAGIFFGELGFGRLINSGHVRAATGANVEATTGQQESTRAGILEKTYLD